MRRLIPLAAFLLLAVLTACSAAPTAAPPTDLPPTAAAPLPPTAAPTLPPAAAATQPAAQPPAAGGTKTFKIVPGESSVRYEVGETFINQDNRFAVAVGVTSEINGEITADPASPQAAQMSIIRVDISQFKSDSNRRDNAIRGRWLESSRFPIATFEPVKIEGLPQQYVEGQDYPLKITGRLTVREAAQEVTFDVVTRLQGGTLSGTATTTLQMSSFGVGPISIAGILNTEDQVKLTLQFVAR